MKGAPKQQQHNNQGRQQQNKPKKQGGKEPEPTVTKKQIDERQQNLLQENLKKLDEDIRKHEHDQKAAYPGLEKAYQLVLDRNKQLQKIPELNQHWVDKTGFLPFLPQDNSTDTTEEVIQFHNVDLANLLKKKYYQFWSQIVYDESLQYFLDSYLRFCERPYRSFSANVSQTPIAQEDLMITYDKDINQQSLFKRVFSVLARISNHEESTTLHMNRKYFADLIYDKKLWDVPKILDLCILYGPRNKEKTARIVARLFELQPKFHEDLSKMLVVIEKTLGDSASRISASVQPESATDVGNFLLDAAATLRALLAIYLPATHHILLFPNIIYRIVNIYETVLPVMEKVLLADAGAKKGYIIGIEAIKHYFLETVHLLIQHCGNYFTVIAQGKNSPCDACRSLDTAKHAEIVVNFLTLLPNAAQHTNTTRKDKGKASASSSSGSGGGSSTAKPTQRFVRDLDKEFGLCALLTQLKGTHSSIDNSRINSLISELGGVTGVTEPQQPTKQPSKTAPAPAKPAQSAAVDVEKLSLISQVKDLFPDLGDGFVDLCLQYYNNSTEKLINALLEGSLPPDLERIDKKLKTAPAAPAKPSPQPVHKEPASYLAQRRNIFDGDEFDIMRNDRIDASKIVKKKDTLDDSAQDRAQLKSLILERALNDDFGEYDDEYDDSYDEFNRMEVGAEGESLNDDEESKKKVTNKGKAPSHGASTSSTTNTNASANDEDEDEDDESGSGSSEEEPSTGGAPQQGGDGQKQQQDSSARGGRGGARGGYTRGSGGRGGKRGGSYKAKSHHQKDKAAKKRGFAGPPQ